MSALPTRLFRITTSGAPCTIPSPGHLGPRDLVTCAPHRSHDDPSSLSLSHLQGDVKYRESVTRYIDIVVYGDDALRDNVALDSCTKRATVLLEEREEIKMKEMGG